MSAYLSTSAQTPPLRAIRQARGISLRKLARITGLDPAHLSRVERGRSGLSVRSLHTVADALGLKELSAHLALYDIQEPTSRP